MGIVKDFRRAAAKLLSGETPKSNAHFDYTGFATGTVWSIGYDGEKNLGELGPAIDYHPNYTMLRIRSWQSYIESGITKTVIDRYTNWVIGSGLKVQAAPNMKVLESEGVTDFTKESRDNFSATVEARYSTFVKSKYSTWAEQKNLAKLEKEAFKNAKIAGDCLVVLRYYRRQVKVQLIDAQHIQSPQNHSSSGNRIVQGVEIDDRGRHVAFHVRTKPLKWERIPAYGERSKQKMAFMIYGSEYRVDSVRGMPLIATVLETLKKLERYKEAVVGSAEERQKIAYQIVHGVTSTNEMPLQKRLAAAMDPDSPGQVPEDTNGNTLANTVAVSTNKQVFNMPNDAELKQLESKNELYFKEFYDTNFDAVCAAVGIPPNVARMLYNDNFSASRAALKDWENSLRVEREDFSDQFNSEIYKFWLWIEVMEGRILAPGFQTAYVEKNWMAVEAFCQSRWIGAQVPHIDPLKEVKAERAKLGPLGNNIPLTTAQRAMENLGTGESEDAMQRFSEEMNRMNELDLVQQQNQEQGNQQSNQSGD